MVDAVMHVASLESVAAAYQIQWLQLLKAVHMFRKDSIMTGCYLIVAGHFAAQPSLQRPKVVAVRRFKPRPCCGILVGR